MSTAPDIHLVVQATPTPIAPVWQTILPTLDDLERLGVSPAHNRSEGADLFMDVANLDITTTLARVPEPRDLTPAAAHQGLPADFEHTMDGDNVMHLVQDPADPDYTAAIYLGHLKPHWILFSELDDVEFESFSTAAQIGAFIDIATEAARRQLNDPTLAFTNIRAVFGFAL